MPRSCPFPPLSSPPVVRPRTEKDGIGRVWVSMGRTLALLALLSGLALGAQKPAPALPQATARMKAWALSRNVPFPLEAPELRVFKQAHTLELWASGKRIKTYRVGLSVQGLAPKVRQGDHLVPEGSYYVCTRNPGSKYHLFLGISYPDPAAAERGLGSGLVTRPQHDQILSAHTTRACPPWNTPLGGTIGLHGHGSNADWTWGCVALNDWDIEELWVTCPLGTPVHIKP